ncbi:MAG TPA: carboxypeptidase-like regulatory domain-containing protein [Pirellulales bacterium]|nr:carboxypeptidase-like regulatory domain-containing protein [Pirellulales bacterium]
MRRQLFHVWLSCSIAFTLSLVIIRRTDAADRTLTIAGTCVAQDGKRVSGANVKLFWLYMPTDSTDTTKLRAEIKTTDNGEFRFPQLPPLVIGREGDWSEYFLIVTHPSFASALIRCGTYLLIREDREQLNVVLEPAASLSGVVTDTAGKPIVGATVYRRMVGGQTPLGIWSDVTDDQGRYCISDLALWAGDETLRVKYVFWVLHPNYGRKMGLYSQVPAKVDFQLGRAGIIEGTVVDLVTGQPAAGVRVKAGGIENHGFSDAKTDAEGRYQLRSLVADRYHVWAKTPERTVVAIRALAVSEGQTIEAPDLNLISGGLIAGRVLHFESKEPVARSAEGWRLTVALEGPSRPRPGSVESVSVADDGTFRIRAAPGENTAYLQCPWMVKGQSRKMPVVVEEGKTIEIEFYIDPQAQSPYQPPPAK